MRFKKCLDVLGGKSHIQLDLEGLSLKKHTQVSDLDQLLRFKIDTYAGLKTNSKEKDWEQVFGPVHKFFDTMTEHEQKVYAALIVQSHFTIRDNIHKRSDTPSADEEGLDGYVLRNLEDTLSTMIASFGTWMNLLDRLTDFVREEIPIQSFAKVGERAQDTAEMTFYREDIINLTAVALLCKLLTPIFGIFIENCKKNMDNSIKEQHCAVLLKGILQPREQLMAKLENFIRQIISPAMKDAKPTFVFNGFTHTSIAYQIYASLLTRRFVGVDLYRPDGNLLTYVTTCARMAAQTSFTSSKKIAVEEIIYTRDQGDMGGGDGNLSTMEVESRKSATTMDVVPLVQAAAVYMRDIFISEYGLAEHNDTLIAAEQYYSSHPIPMTMLNTYLMCSCFDMYLGGARSVEVLDARTCNHILPMFQLYLIKMGFQDLAHAVALIPTNRMKSTLTKADNQLLVTWNASYEYKNCDDRFPHIINDMRWDTKLKEIVEDITRREYIYGSAPAIWDMTGKHNHTNKVYATSDQLSRSICGLLQLRSN